jgi:hypothetical protein
MEQGWIQMKNVHVLYQVQVVSDDVYIRVSHIKPQKWPTQLALTEMLICVKPPNLFICSHLKKFQKVLVKGHKSFIQDQKVRNACLCLQERENHLGKIIIPKNH